MVREHDNIHKFVHISCEEENPMFLLSFSCFQICDCVVAFRKKNCLRNPSFKLVIYNTVTTFGIHPCY